MRVSVRSTPQRLSLRLAPVKLAAYWIFGVAFIAAAFWTMSAMGHATVFSCSDERSCRLARRSLTGGSHLEIAASDLRPARVDTTLGLVAGMQLVVVTSRAEYRSRGVVQVRRRRWFGRRLLEMPLDQLEGVATRPFTFRQTRSWSVVLEFGGGHGPVPLSAMPMFTDASAELVKRTIDEWLPAR